MGEAEESAVGQQREHLQLLASLDRRVERGIEPLPWRPGRETRSSAARLTSSTNPFSSDDELVVVEPPKQLGPLVAEIARLEHGLPSDLVLQAEVPLLHVRNPEIGIDPRTRR